ncbi:MAG: ABC transporter ATP-binding protein [Lachnospiraceae bacterium]|nr:ABC transporter ATP-binding protein [Lachnospiraceae bacterium]
MALEIRHVSKVFEGTKKETLQNINLTVENGEFICIVGPSGCGKSTLLNQVAGLDTPTAGEIFLDGVKITRPGSERMVMFQESALYPWLTVKENVVFGMKLAGLLKEEQEKKAEYYLKMVQLWDFRNYAIHEISGGMKQRTALARALTLDCKVLLMDEPFSALDKQTTNMLREELEQIWEKTHKTIFFITHSVEEAVYFADRVVILSDNPGTIKEIVKIDLQRPRKIDSDEFITLRSTILDLVQREVHKIAENEYDKE